MISRTCDYLDCNKKAQHVGLCKAHYQKEWRQKSYIKKRIAEYGRKKYRTPVGRYNLLKGRVKTVGLSFNISFELFESLISERCFYCQKWPDGKSTGAGLDRIDTNKGYVFNNVVPSCWLCNRLRGNHLTVAETKAAVAAIMALRASQRG